MPEYHKYVFDQENRTFVGKFEDMYRAEAEKGFDSWNQDDARHLDKRFCLDVLAQYNFNRILDVGCGKGMITQYLKKQNNHVLGIDLSESALRVAKTRFPDIQFKQADITLDDWVDKISWGGDLIVCMEALSYIENWRDVLKTFGKIGKYVMIALFIPENPIGYVKSFDQLSETFERHFEIEEDIRLMNRNKIILFGKSRRNLV